MAKETTKSDTPNGLLLSPEFKEVIKRIKNRESELDEMVKREASTIKAKGGKHGL